MCAPGFPAGPDHGHHVETREGLPAVLLDLRGEPHGAALQVRLFTGLRHAALMHEALNLIGSTYTSRRRQYMLKKRLLVLAVMLCSLAFVASESAGTASAGSWCTCAATSCGECVAECYPDPDTPDKQVESAALSCCQQNWKAIGCGDVSAATAASGVSQ